MRRKQIFFKRPARWRFGWLLGGAILAVGLSWSLHGGFGTRGLPACDSAAARQEIGRSLAAGWPAQESGVEVVSYRENRRRLAGDVVEARDCAARIMQVGTPGIVRYTVLRQSDGDGFRIDVTGQAAQQGQRR